MGRRPRATLVVVVAVVARVLCSLLLRAQLDGGKAVLATSVDPSIMGGLTVKIGDKFLDLSVKSKIDTVKRSLSTA